MSNVLEIARWLDHEQGGVKDEWRPTRQLKGLVVRYDDQVTSVTREVRHHLRDETVTRYQAGVVLVNRAESLGQNQHVEIDLPGLFSGEARTWIHPTKHTLSHKTPSGTDHAIAIASRFAKLPGATVVFLGLKSSVERCAREVARQLPEPVVATEARATAALQLAGIVGTQHELPQLVEKGVAYHHADLPAPARRIVETALSDGTLQLVTATATLQEGMNTPTSTVIIVGAQRFDLVTGTTTAMSEPDFANIAGRAGRAGRDTEGQVIFLPSRLDQSVRVRMEGLRYLLPDDEAFRITSALRAMQDELESADVASDIGELTPATQSMLLALEAAGLASEQDLQQFFGSTLATYQSGYPSEKIAATSHSFLTAAQERIGRERLACYSKTGLSISDCELLDAAITSLIESGYDVEASLLSEAVIDASRLAPLVEAVFSVPRLRSSSLNSVDTQAAANVISAWVNGGAYLQISSLPVFGGDIEKAVKFLGLASRQMSWGLGSIFLLLDTITSGAVNPEFGLLPLFVEYGVNTPVSAFLSLLGVSDREAAMALGKYFVRAHESNNSETFDSFSSVESWAQTLTADEVIAVAVRFSFPCTNGA